MMTIKKDEKTGTVDITGLHWNHYSKVMSSLDRMLTLLETPIEGNYQDNNRNKLLADYKELLDNLTLPKFPWHGEGRSTEDHVIMAINQKRTQG